MTEIRNWILSAELITSPALPVTVALCAIVLVAVLGPKPRHLVLWSILLLVGTAGGYALVKVLEGQDAFDGPLPEGAAPWAAVGIGVAVMGVGLLFSRPWWRRALAVLLVVVGLVAGGLGVNASFGLTHNLATILGVQALDSAALVDPTDNDDALATLYQTWTPPADMPTAGTVGALTGDEAIPAAGFAPRDAALYLPPAALVKNPPKLPVIVFMMGQPGTPDPDELATALDDYAAAHHGLAPIAIVADQLGALDVDPACQDSDTFGAVSTYFNQEIPAYIDSHLNVVSDHRYWVIAGYSNGGSCALTWGSQHPEIWGNIMDISGNKYPGQGHDAEITQTVFGGDKAAFQAALPENQMKKHAGAYAGHVAVLTHGDQDQTYGPGQEQNAQLAQTYGFTVFTHTVANAGHTGPALSEGLAYAIDALGPSLGLAAPPQ